MGYDAPVPDFATHYYHPDRPPFSNLSDLDDADVGKVLAALGADVRAGRSARRFGPRYLALRRATERRLRDRFVERGGLPERVSPHYFVLGQSAWFRGLYEPVAEVRLALLEVPSHLVSITFPDSVTSMGLLAEFGVEVTPRPWHGQVFRLEELPDALARYGWPNSARPTSYDGHQHDDFEHYVEVQLWSDGPLENSGPDGWKTRVTDTAAAD